MADALTPNLLVTNMENGSHDNTWGDVLNANNDIFDAKLGDVTAIVSTGGTTVLTTDEERVNLFEVSGVLSSNKILQFSGRGGTWLVENNTTGSFSLTCKLSAEDGVTVPQGGKALIYCDTVGIRRLISSPVDTTEGGTGAAAGAAMVLLQSGTAAAASALAIAIDQYGSTYRALKIILTDFTGNADGFYPYLRVATDGVPNFIATNYAYQTLELGSTGTLVASGAQIQGSGGLTSGGTEIPLTQTWNDPDVGTTTGLEAEITIYESWNAARLTNFKVESVYTSSSGRTIQTLGSGQYKAAAAITDIQIDAYQGAGVSAVSCRWALYGLL